MTFEHWAIFLTILCAVLIALHFMKFREGYYADYDPDGGEVIKYWHKEVSYLEILLRKIGRVAVAALILIIGMIIGGAVW